MLDLFMIVYYYIKAKTVNLVRVNNHQNGALAVTIILFWQISNSIILCCILFYTQFLQSENGLCAVRDWASPQSLCDLSLWL